MHKVLIDWRESHHPKDAHSQIESSIASGLDEGPLIAVPTGPYRRPGRGKIAPTIFSDVNAYLAHLAFYEGEVGDERYIGIVREASDKDTAFQALALIQNSLSPGSDGVLRIRSKTAGRQAFDYCVTTVSFDPVAAAKLQIESIGEDLNSLLHYHPDLKAIIGAEGQDDDDDDEW